MKLYYTWENEGGSLAPNCRSSVVNKDNVSLIACILTDSGGQNYRQTIPWLEDGIDKITSIRTSVISFSDWSRETWGAELTQDEVKIYSLHDEEYFEKISLDGFEKALISWRDFLQNKPEVFVKEEIEIQ